MSHALGALAPSRVVDAADATEVAATLRAAGPAGESVVVYGGGTLQHANPPLRYDVALLTTQLDALHDYDPRDLTIGVGAGMTVAALQRTLAEHGQFLPLDAPRARTATVGGTLAAGWAGPRRALYGRPRDLLIGSTVALADGTLAASGGMVVKNVTGYDMGKVYVGSHGTLAAFVRANFKVLPAPAARRFASAPFDPESYDRAVAQMLALEIEPAALVFVDGFVDAAPERAGTVAGPDPCPRLVALLEGSEASVERATRDLRSALGAAGIAETHLVDGAAAERAFQTLLDAYIAPAANPSLTYLARGLPAAAAARAQSVRTALAPLGETRRRGTFGIETIADVRTGDVLVRWSVKRAALDPADAAAADDAVRGALGTATVLACDPFFIGRIDAWGAAPGSLATMQGMKRRFDPHGVLAPGRFVGGI